MWANCCSSRGKLLEEIDKAQEYRGKLLDEIYKAQEEAFGLDSKTIESLWSTYDKDKNGALDIAELRKFISDYGGHAMRRVQQQKKGLEREAHIAKKNESPKEGLYIFPTDECEYEFLLAASDGLQLPLQMYQDMYENASSYECAALKFLDTNDDGNVSKEEFMNKLPLGVQLWRIHMDVKMKQKRDKEIQEGWARAGAITGKPILEKSVTAGGGCMQWCSWCGRQNGSKVKKKKSKVTILEQPESESKFAEGDCMQQ